MCHVRKQRRDGVLIRTVPRPRTAPARRRSISVTCSDEINAIVKDLGLLKQLFKAKMESKAPA